MGQTISTVLAANETLKLTGPGAIKMVLKLVLSYPKYVRPTLPDGPFFSYSFFSDTNSGLPSMFKPFEFPLMGGFCCWQTI